MSPGLLKKSRKVQDENEDKANSLQAVPVIDATAEKFVAEENSLSVLEAIKEEERQLAAEKRQLTDTLEQLQLKSDTIADRKSHLLEEMEKNISFKQQKNEKEPVLQLF